MKKIVIVFSLLALLLTGCASSDKGLAKNEKVLTQEEFKNCFKIVTLTTDNWKDYFELGDYTDPTDGTVVLTYGLKEEYKKNLCGSPQVFINFEVDYHEFSGEYNADTGELIYSWNDEDTSTTREEYYYPKNSNSNDRGQYYYQDYIIETYREYASGYSEWEHCNIVDKYIYDVKDVRALAIEGSLCYANYSDDMFNTNSLGERYICFNTEKGTRVSLFENGLYRWDRGSGYGYGNGNDLFDYSYFDFFENK